MAVGARSSSLAQLIQDSASLGSSVAPVIKKALNNVAIPRARTGSGGTGIATSFIDVLGNPSGPPPAERSLNKDKVTGTGVGAAQTKPVEPTPSALTTPSKRVQKPKPSLQLTAIQKKRLGFLG